MVGIKGKRVPGRPGRFDPTEPLHMKTRKATRGSNGTEGSHDDGSPEQVALRRSSNETTSTRRSSLEGLEPPTKRQRTTEPSPNVRTKSPSLTEPAIFDDAYTAPPVESASNGAAREDESEDDEPPRNYDDRLEPDGAATREPVADVATSPNEAGMVTRQQSVSSKATTPNIGSATSTRAIDHSKHDVNDTEAHADAESQQESLDDRFGVFAAFATNVEKRCEDTEQEIPDSELQPTQESMESNVNSSASSPSDPQAFEGVNMPALSADVTPMVTRQGTPTTPAFGDTPARSRGMVLDLGDSTDEEGNELVAIAPTQDIADDAVDPAADEEEEGEEGTVQRRNKRRYPGGRRRATHANIVVEAAMRRQLELKQVYRQVTRAMKATLGELSQITLDELDTNEEAHKQADEYEKIMAELNARLAKRKEQLFAAQRFNEEQLRQRWHAERDARKNRCENKINDLKDEHRGALEYNILRVERDRLSATAVHEQVTEDEDGIIPRPKAMAYRYKRGEAIDTRYDSRSRFALETDRKIRNLAPRIRVWDELKAYGLQPGDGFTVMDREAREAAQERQESISRTKVLAAAAVEHEKRSAPKPAPPPPSAKDLMALNTLADIAGRPSLQLKYVPPGQSLPPPRPSPMPAMSMPDAIGYPRQSPHQAPRQPMMSVSELSQGMAYPRQSPRQPARSLPEAPRPIGFPLQSPRQQAQAMASGAPHSVQHPQQPLHLAVQQSAIDGEYEMMLRSGLIAPRQSPRQSAFPHTQAGSSSQRSEGEVASQLPRPTLPEQTMGPPPMPVQATAPPHQSPMLRRPETSTTTAPMGVVRGEGGTAPLTAKTSETERQQQDRHPHSHAPSFPPFSGVHPDRINIIAEANNMEVEDEDNDMKPSGESKAHTEMNPANIAMNPTTMHYNPDNPVPPPWLRQPHVLQQGNEANNNHAMHQNTIRAPPQPYHYAQPPYQLSSYTQPHQYPVWHNERIPERMPGPFSNRRNSHNTPSNPQTHPHHQPLMQNFMPAPHLGLSLPPRPPPTSSTGPDNLPRRPPSPGTRTANAPRKDRRKKPSLEDRGGISRKTRKDNRQETRDAARARAASTGTRNPDPAPEPELARRASALPGIPPRPPFAPPMPWLPSLAERVWGGSLAPPVPTAAPVDHFGGGMAAQPVRRLSRAEEEREEEMRALERMHGPGTFFPRRH